MLPEMRCRRTFQRQLHKTTNIVAGLQTMKIALLTTDSREHDRDYASTVPAFGTAPQALLVGFSEIQEVEVHVVSCLQQPVSSPQKIANNIYYHGLLVPKPGWLRTAYQGCVRAVRRRLKEIQPDIVHAQGTERDCSISAVFSGFPNLLTLHGNMRVLAKLHHAKPWSYLGLAAILEHLALRRAGGVICITKYTEKNVHGLNSRTWKVPNAVDPSFFSVTNEPDEPPTILCVGFVCSRKNQNALIDALAPLSNEIDFRLLILGNASSGGAYTETFFRKVSQYPWVTYGGFAGRDALKAAFAKASLVVLPSLEDNCPMVVLEAAAAGIPVVAAQVGGVPEIVEHEVNGLLCNPLDAGSIRNTVRRTLTRRDQARAFALEGKRRAQEQFHPVSIAKRHIAIYRELLERRCVAVTV
jgi:glycosyltransferase involved in cell wall biosynthesis